MEVPEVVKKNWPIALGAVAGIGILIYMSRGNSGGGSSDYAAMLQASAQNTAANQSFALAKSAQDAQIAQADKALNVQAMQAQGAMVGAIASAAGGLVQSLNAPTVAALNAGAAENIATIQGAVANSIAGYTAQGSILQSTAAASSAYAQSLAAQSQALSNAVSASQQAMASQAQAENAANARTNEANAAAGAKRTSTYAGLASTALMAFSDERVKKNVEPVARDSVADIAALEFVQFDYDESKVGVQLIPHFDVGVLAQRAEAINSNWVVEVEDVKQIVLPTMLLSALHAIQILTARIEELENKNG